MSVPGADPRVLGPYLARELGDSRWEEPTVEVVVGGRSNLTYYVTSPAGSVVLRRPPLRAVRPTAHDMTREHRVLCALHGPRSRYQGRCCCAPTRTCSARRST